MRKLVFGLVAVAAWCGRADAGGLKMPPGFDPASGQVLPVPATNWITGQPVPCPKFMPVVGSAVRTSHFSHPFTGEAKYTGKALDPSTGHVFTYKFRH